MPKLAIVIPAFKITYFESVLKSISNQSSKEFTLYIGNDASPYDFKSIVDLYTAKIKIVYKRFDENLGGRDLVAQWERCIDLVGEEEWIWLFSDDDIMDPTCVENFYRTVSQYPLFDLFHFNVLKIDERENIIENFFKFPEILSSEEFILTKLRGGYFSTVVEYIFRKSHFIEKGRFQNFDLAWGSDDATWIKLGRNMGIKNIDKSAVYWRSSPINISSIIKEKSIVIRKLNAQINFANWICEKAKKEEIKIQGGTLQKHLERWFIRAIKSRIEILPYEMIVSLLRRFNFTFDKKKNSFPNIVRLYLYKTQRKIIEICRNLFIR